MQRTCGGQENGSGLNRSDILGLSDRKEKKGGETERVRTMPVRRVAAFKTLEASIIVV